MIELKKVTGLITIVSLILLMIFLSTSESNEFNTAIWFSPFDFSVNISLPIFDSEYYQLKLDENLNINLNVNLNGNIQADSSTAVIKQVGEIQRALQNQSGFTNLAVIYQEGSKNFAEQIQEGNYNNAITIQKGQNNKSIQYQYSNNNIAVIIQTGVNNFAEQYQGVSGQSGNKSIVIQKGNGNYIRVIQN